MTNPQADPGWYDDPSSPGSQAERYWNGTEWTPRRRPKTPTQLSHPDSLSSGHTNPAADRADPVQWPPTPPPPPPHGPSAARSYPDPADPTRTNIWNGVQWADARQNTGSPGSGSVPYPDASGYQSPQGPAWPPQPPGGIPPFQPPPMAFAPQEKSSAVAVVLTILWPGAGHLYLGPSRHLPDLAHHSRDDRRRYHPGDQRRQRSHSSRAANPGMTRSGSFPTRPGVGGMSP